MFGWFTASQEKIVDDVEIGQVRRLCRRDTLKQW
jgi:hypothetical protein